MSDTKSYKNILAIDGSTPICTVALRVGEQSFERRAIGMAIHSSAIFSQINELLTQASIQFQDIDAVVIGIGPGSYTGLRVVASSIKGLLFRNTIPLYGVSTLAGFAACVKRKSTRSIHVIIDARRNHLYYQCFSADNEGALIPDRSPLLVEIPDLYTKINPGDSLIGTGIDRLEASRLNQVDIISQNQISASGLIQVFLGFGSMKSDWVESLDPTEFEPKYDIKDFK